MNAVFGNLNSKMAKHFNSEMEKHIYHDKRNSCVMPKKNARNAKMRQFEYGGHFFEGQREFMNEEKGQFPSRKAIFEYCF